MTVPTGANVTLYGNGYTIYNVGKIQVGTTASSWSTTLNLGSTDGGSKNELTISGISGNTNAMIYVYYSTLNMYDGVTLTGNENTTTARSEQGGAVCAAHSNFYMYGGVVSGNSSGYGGGIFVFGCNDASFTMSGGEVTGNTATPNSGGGVGCYVVTTTTISGGKISGNETAEYGGGLIVGTYTPSNSNQTYYGDLVIRGGEISNNTATGSHGGGVQFYGNSFTMSGGKITDNVAGDSGGGILINLSNTDCSDLAASITGGTISSNQCTWYGGGVYVYGISRATFTMDGATISDNSLTFAGE